MDLKTLHYVRSNYYITSYLREHSYWYKYLTRNPNSIQELEKETKEYFRLRPKDKMEDLEKRLMFIRQFMDILN